MSVYLVTVEAWDHTGNGDYYDATVLAFNERSARQLATRAVAKQGYTGAHSVGAVELDRATTGAILITERSGRVFQRPVR